MSQTETAILTDRLRAHLPRFVLQTLAATSGHVGQLLRRVQKWYPGQDSLRDQIHQLVEGFEQRGDIERGRGGLLRCLPPHVLEDSLGSPFIPVYGSPAAERYLMNVLQCEVVYGWTGHDITRYLMAGSRKISSAEMASCGVTVFNSEAILERVPDVSALPWPHSRSFGVRSYSEGYWEAYDPRVRPTGYQEGRWVSVTEWNNLKARLVRWSPVANEGDGSRMYYLHIGVGRIYEVSRDEARLWQYAVDREVGLPTEWRYQASTGVVAVNGMLPSLVARTMRSLSVNGVQRDGFHYRYSIPRESKAAIEALAGRLGVRLIPG